MDKRINRHFKNYLDDWGHKFYFLVGGYGSSKSYHTALKIIVKLVKEKRTALVVRQVYDTIRDSCFSLLVELIGDMGLEEYIKYYSSPMQLRFKNGSKIIFKGMDRPEKLKSINNVTVIWAEECAELTYDGFKELLGRLRHPDIPLHFLLTTNPVDKNNWTYKHFIERLGGAELEQQLYVKGELSAGNVFFNHSTVCHNHFVSRDYVAQLNELRQYDPELYRVARLGRFGVSGLLVLPQLEVWAHEKVMAEVNGLKDGVFRVGMDFGFEVSFNACLRMAVDRHKKTLFVYWEYYKNRMTDDKTASELSEFVSSGEVIRADCAEPKTIAYYRQQGFKMVGAKKFPGSRIANLKKVKRFKSIICSEACQNTVRELKGLTYAKDRQGNIKPDEFNIDPHTLSAIWYGLDGFELSDVKGARSFSGKGRR